MSEHSARGPERAIDANLNRLREGLRVLEDINRYIYDEGDLSRRFKRLRHRVREAWSIERVMHRDAQHDVGRGSTESEMLRDDIGSIVVANFSRSEESCRVLEELFKLQKPELSTLFKELRYELYDLEKETFRIINSF